MGKNQGEEESVFLKSSVQGTGTYNSQIQLQNRLEEVEDVADLLRSSSKCSSKIWKLINDQPQQEHKIQKT